MIHTIKHPSQVQDVPSMHTLLLKACKISSKNFYILYQLRDIVFV